MSAKPLLPADLKRGDEAPPIIATAIDGLQVDRDFLRDRLLLISFGETGQEKSEEAWQQISALLEDETLRNEPIAWIVVLSKGSEPGLFTNALTEGPKPIIIHDSGRELFGAFEVIVLPSAVVVNREGKVAHAMSGLTNRFSDSVRDAIDFALGRISELEFEQLLHPAAEVEPDQAFLRSQRHAHLADRLQERGMIEMAESEYRQAVEVDPQNTGARLALARLLLNREAIDEAESHLRNVLAADADSTDAALGIAEIGAARGGAALEESESMVGAVLARDPSNARAHFIAGLIAEKREDPAAALFEFKTAAQILLNAPRIPDKAAENDRDTADTQEHQ
jgi:tetratricopeptide (TPR) repeat protein